MEHFFIIRVLYLHNFPQLGTFVHGHTRMQGRPQASVPITANNRQDVPKFLQDKCRCILVSGP